MKYNEVTKNKRLVHFAELRDYVVHNSVKIEQPKKKKKEEEDSSLLLFGKKQDS
ncbi:MAG: hypothetical protein ACE5FT_05900 [Candidatus Nanoarchaeia archaeon]